MVMVGRWRELCPNVPGHDCPWGWELGMGAFNQTTQIVATPGPTSLTWTHKVCVVWVLRESLGTRSSNWPVVRPGKGP